MNKSLKKIKRDTQIIIISVIILTIVTLNVSYSAFFSVETQSAIQEFETGELNVSITSPAIQAKSLFPTEIKDLPTDKSSNVTGNDYSTLTLTNQGTLDADFAVTVSEDQDEIQKVEGGNEKKADLENIYIGIYDDDKKEWIAFNGSEDLETKYYTPISSLTRSNSSSDENPEYPILRDIVKSSNHVTKDATEATEKSTRTYKVYVWLSPDTPTTEINKLVYLKLNVRSTTIDEKTPKELQG